MRRQLPGHLQTQYAWAGVSVERLKSSGVSDKEKKIGEVFTPNNFYPGTVNDKALTKPGVLFLVGKMMFCFATTGQSVRMDDAKDMVKEIIAMDAKYLTLHMEVLRVMQEPANVCDALWKVRALLYVGRWTEAAQATVLAVTGKPKWKISGYLITLITLITLLTLITLISLT